MPLPLGAAEPLPSDVYEPLAVGAASTSFVCDACRMAMADMPRCGDCRFCAFCCVCRLCPRCSRAASTHCNTCSMCVTCCQCVECPRCHVRRERMCTECQGCIGHCCGCFTCERCHRRLPGGTPRTGGLCIDCHPNGFFFFNVAAPQFHEASRIIDRRRNHSSRFLAGEIEISSYNGNGYNTNTAKAVRKWGGAIVRDGSVAGGEINTAPAAGDKWLDQISEICAALEVDGASVSSNAGGHLHVDARDFSFFDIRRFVFLYEKIENGLFQLVNPTRRSNDYCHRVGDHHIRRLALGRLAKGADKESIRKENKVGVITGLYGTGPTRNFKEIRRNKGSNVRYQACNLHSWMHRGTIECRLMQGSVDPDNWQCWGMLWAGILDTAMKRTEKDIIALEKQGPGNDLLLNEIAPNDRVRSWITWSRLRYGERVVM